MHVDGIFGIPAISDSSCRHPLWVIFQANFSDTNDHDIECFELSNNHFSRVFSLESIGDSSLMGTMSQYSSSTALWCHVHGSALNTTSVAYTGSGISSAWTKFFGSGPTYWSVYNYTVSFPKIDIGKSHR
jgi:hypothetical protein